MHVLTAAYFLACRRPLHRLQLSADIAKHLTYPRVDIQDLVALGVDKKDGVVGMIEDLVESSLFGPAQLLLGLLVGSDRTLQLSDAPAKQCRFVGELEIGLL